MNHDHDHGHSHNGDQVMTTEDYIRQQHDAYMANELGQAVSRAWRFKAENDVLRTQVQALTAQVSELQDRVDHQRSTPTT